MRLRPAVPLLPSLLVASRLEPLLLAQPADSRPAALLDEIGAREYLELVKEARLVRGFNLPGGGLAVEERIDDETDERCVDVIALSSTEIGGRVPTSVVNSATAGAMVAVFVGLGKALERQHPGTEICPHINGRGTS